MEIPIKMDDLGVPPFSETPISPFITGFLGPPRPRSDRFTIVRKLVYCTPDLTGRNQPTWRDEVTQLRPVVTKYQQDIMVLGCPYL